MGFQGAWNSSTWGVGSWKSTWIAQGWAHGDAAHMEIERLHFHVNQNLLQARKGGASILNVPVQGSWPSPTNRNWLEARQEIQARFFWDLCYSREEQEQATDSIASLAPLGGASLFLAWGEGREVSRGWAGAVAYLFCPPRRWCCVQGACSVCCFCSWHPAFAPGSLKVAGGFLGFFVAIVQNLP